MRHPTSQTAGEGPPSAEVCTKRVGQALGGAVVDPAAVRRAQQQRGHRAGAPPDAHEQPALDALTGHEPKTRGKDGRIQGGDTATIGPRRRVGEPTLGRCAADRTPVDLVQLTDELDLDRCHCE